MQKTFALIPPFLSVTSPGLDVHPAFSGDTDRNKFLKRNVVIWGTVNFKPQRSSQVSFKGPTVLGPMIC